LSAEVRQRPALPFELPFYYGWVQVFIAALAMVGTLPGRTQGLGLITEPLLRDLRIDRVHFAHINLWATLIGALFSVGVGRLIDRFGSRIVLTVVTVALASVVMGMSAAKHVAAIAILITLTRGFGQSALSVVSITMVGQWFVRRLNLAMAIYTVALSVGFMMAFPLIGAIVLARGCGLGGLPNERSKIAAGQPLGLACAALADLAAADLEFRNAREVFLALGAAPDLDRLDALTGGPRFAEGLSDRERDVLTHLAAGKTNKEIAEALGISPHTVRRHVEHIFTKLGVTSRAAATAHAYEHGLVTRAE